MRFSIHNFQHHTEMIFTEAMSHNLRSLPVCHRNNGACPGSPWWVLGQCLRWSAVPYGKKKEWFVPGEWVIKGGLIINIHPHMVCACREWSAGRLFLCTQGGAGGDLRHIDLDTHTGLSFKHATHLIASSRLLVNVCFEYSVECMFAFVCVGPDARVLLWILGVWYGGFQITQLILTVIYFKQIVQ